MPPGRRRDWVRRLAVCVVALMWLGIGGTMPVTVAEAQGPRLTGSPEEVYKAMIDALRAGDRTAMLRMLGPDAKDLVSSGDDVADRQAWKRFVEAYDRAHRLEASDGKIVLVVGTEEYPAPIPLVPDGEGWKFDTAAGREEIRDRRVGRNELSTIQVCLAIVDAQREYYALGAGRTGYLEYAQRMISTPGKRDGLYWPTKPGEPPSPLGELAARARAQGYEGSQARGRAPFHGYFYRLLTAQGPSAPGGAYDYVVRGHMIGGFGVVAFPARYGESGVMTFIVNHDGVVYQKDLGAATARTADAMKIFNPGPGWQLVDPGTARK
jgi:Protein of unknown function (DUF2950)